VKRFTVHRSPFTDAMSSESGSGYLKQYARDEETREYGDQGDITIDIDKTHQ
jgi:hypothetical protein